MSRSETWMVSRSRLPELLGSGFLVAIGSASAVVDQGWLWWCGLTGVLLGAAWLVHALRRAAEPLRIVCQGRIRVETADGRAIAEGLVGDSSAVTSWLVVLRVYGDDGRRQTSVVLDAWSAPADDLRRLRVRLLTDESIRA